MVDKFNVKLVFNILVWKNIETGTECRVRLSPYQLKIITCILNGIYEKEVHVFSVWGVVLGKNENYLHILYGIKRKLLKNGFPKDFFIINKNKGACINYYYFGRGNYKCEIVKCIEALHYKILA